MNNRKDYTFEVCANSVESCMAAQRGGADRVELCAAIPEGGTTPSFGEMTVARQNLDIRLNVIIRPRGGDFLYSPMEVQTMVADIAAARQIHADGLVLGCLTADGDIDLEVLDRLMDAAGDVPVTFHRAFDRCRNPLEALWQLKQAGVRRILTSGGQPCALQGVPLLRRLVEAAAGDIIIMPGCGVNETNIAAIARDTGAREFHFSAREAVASAMRVRNEEVVMGSADADEYTRMVTTAGRVSNTIAALCG